MAKGKGTLTRPTSRTPYAPRPDTHAPRTRADHRRPRRREPLQETEIACPRIYRRLELPHLECVGAQLFHESLRAGALPKSRGGAPLLALMGFGFLVANGSLANDWVF